MSVTVAIPWREQPDRVEAFERVTAWWRGNGFKVVTSDSGHEVFNVAAARNAAVELATTEKIIVADADTIPALGNIQQALAADGVAYPFDVYRYLGPHAPEPYELDGSPFERDLKGSVGGIFVTTKRTFATLGRQDEGFQQWGYEDSAFYHAAVTLSTVTRIPGFVYAYGHDAPRVLTNENPGRHRVQLYAFASGKPEVMHELIADRL